MDIEQELEAQIEGTQLDDKYYQDFEYINDVTKNENTTKRIMWIIKEYNLENQYLYDWNLIRLLMKFDDILSVVKDMQDELNNTSLVRWYQSKF